MSLLAQYRAAASASSRPLATVLLEALKLRFSGHRLGLSEYLDFQLYQDDLSHAQKAAFGGIRAQKVLEDILIDDYSRFLSLDKVTMYSLMVGHGLPVPTVRATYRALRPAATLSLRTGDELAQYLTAAGSLPVYIKRAFGSYGRGNTLVQAVEKGNVVLGNGTSEPLIKFVESLDDGRSLGWILQDPLVCHPDITQLTRSSKVSGVRIHTFLAPAEPKVVKAIFKINVGKRDSDNFEHGASGNMLGALDISSGKVMRAISGTGLGQQLNPSHPVTGVGIAGFQVPCWREVLALVKDAQTAFPGFICPGWDIAICPDGPRILEVNAFGDIDLSQHSYREGFFDADFLALMKQRGLVELLHGPAGETSRSPVNNRLGRRRHHWLW